MADTDKLIGYVMAGIGSIVIIIEFITLILQPAFDNTILKDLPPGQYWGLAIPAFIAIFGIFGIIVWIGITMIKTPPPQEWEFEDIVDEVEAEGEVDQEPAQEKPKAKSKAKKAETKAEPAKEEKPKKAKAKAKKAAAKAGSKSFDDLDGMTSKVKDGLAEAGIDSVDKVAAATVEELVAIKGIGQKTAERLKASASE